MSSLIYIEQTEQHHDNMVFVHFFNHVFRSALAFVQSDQCHINNAWNQRNVCCENQKFDQTAD